MWLEEVLRVALPSLKVSGVAIRCLAAAVPALVLVLFAGLIALIGLFMGEDRRKYVLELTMRLTELARVLMGPPLAPEASTDPAAIDVGATTDKPAPESSAPSTR